VHISLIAAIAKNGVIGKGVTLPWHYPEDMKFFRQTTQGKVVIMGRKTFVSLGNKPLPNRVNIVITRDKQFDQSNVDCIVVHSVDAALEAARHAKGEDQEVMVIGGADIYALFLPLADKLYLTMLHQDHDGDVFFPTVNWKNWILLSEKPYTHFAIKIFERSR
jgi:dihydrofolate reductase